jgi:outer membrane lipoprotein SlyB
VSTTLLVILTVVEIVALVAVLALFVILITRRLRSLANAIGQLSGTTIGGIQGDVFLVGAGAAILNRKLNAIAGALPAIAEKAESLPAQQTGARARR